MKGKLPILLLLFGLFIAPNAYGQLGGLDIFSGSRNKEEPKETRDYNKYDIEKYVQERNKPPADSSSLKQRLMVTPEELYKLGASPELIEQLMELNFKQDSLQMIQDELDKMRYEKSLGGKSDSLNINDIRKVIELQKAEIIAKALALPAAYVHGHEFFRKNLMKPYDKNIDTRPPPHYIMGVGDEINVVMWGNIDYNQVFTIDQAGAITPDLAGRIYLRGLTYENARQVIKNRFAKVYDLNESKMDVSITYARVIATNFVGELFNPGSYRFPAMTSVFNALVAIDGPTQLGSVRNIHIRRGGQTIKNLDVYEYLNNPDSRLDFFLEENDYVVVPALGKVVNISGEVKRPFNYEIKTGEGLQDVIEFAGGLKAEAFTRTINVKRYQGNKEVLIDIDLDSLRVFNTDFLLENGDSIFVYRVPVGVRNYVQVVGAVQVPGKYEIKKGDRVNDILLKTKGVLDEADIGRAYVIRLQEDMTKQMIPFNLDDVLSDVYSPENIALQNLDTIEVISRKDTRQDFYVKILGAVQKPGTYQYAEGLSLSDLIYRSGGMLKEAANTRVEVSRMIRFSDELTGKNSEDRMIVKRMEVGRDLSIDRNEEVYQLQPYDHVYVRVAADFEEPQTVKLFGEVVYPGEYTLLSKEERISSLVDRAGGFTKYAFMQGGKLYRWRDSTGYVLLDLTDALQNPKKSKFNYILADKDSVYVPEIKNLVTLGGAIGHFELDTIPQISVPFEEGRRADYYVKRYGAGFGKYAKRSRTFVKQPNGKVQKTRRPMGLFKVYPKVENGATVFVDVTQREKNRPQREKRRKNRSWNDAFDKVASITVTLLTILLLVQQARP